MMKKLGVTLIFVVGVLALVVPEAATIFSLSETWRSFMRLVSRLTKPLPPTQVSIVGIFVLVGGLLLLLFGIVVAYREIRKSGSSEDGPKLPQIGLNPEQESALLLLLQRENDGKNKKPRRSALAVAMVLVAVGVAMVLQGSHEFEVRRGPSVAVGDNEVVTGQQDARSKGETQGRVGPKTNEHAVRGTTAKELPGSEAKSEAFKSSECGCPGLPPREQGAPESEALPEIEESPEAPESEQPEVEEPPESEEPEFTEAEFEEVEFEEVP